MNRKILSSSGKIAVDALLPVLKGLVGALKGLKAGTLALATASALSMRMIFSWDMAAALMGIILFHELGHLAAMKRCALRTNGVTFVPLLGAYVSGEPTRILSWSEIAYIGLAGPVMGLATALMAMLFYARSSNPFWASVAAWSAAINVINLVPMYPLDGGRVMRAIMSSTHNLVTVGIVVVSLIAAPYYTREHALYFPCFFSFLGVCLLLIEAITEKSEEEQRERKLTQKMSTCVMAGWVSLYFALGVALVGIVFMTKDCGLATTPYDMLKDF